MRFAWDTLKHMPVMIQIRNVPDKVHRRLKSKAAMLGKSLSDLLLEEVVHFAALPTNEEIRERLAALPPLDLPENESAAAIIRERRGT